MEPPVDFVLYVSGLDYVTEVIDTVVGWGGRVQRVDGQILHCLMAQDAYEHHTGAKVRRVEPGENTTKNGYVADSIIEIPESLDGKVSNHLLDM